MAESFIQYTASGSTDTFSIPFGYLDEDHISVKLDGVSTAFTFPSSSQVQITSGNPTAGTIVEVRRTTPRDSREIVWQNAANLTEDDLNTSDLQFLYITQEAFDAANETIQLDADDTWDADNKVIKNVATPSSNNDAVNKAYADANLLATAQDVVDAEAAKVAAELAQTGAETAESNAQTVLTQMQLLYDDWDDRYLGSKASDPTVDNDGDPLEDGALYFNTTSNNLRVYDLGSTTWLVVDTVIPDDSISNTKLSNMAEATIKGRSSGSGTGDPEDLTPAQVRTAADVYSTSEVYTQSEVDTLVAGAGGDRLSDIKIFESSGTWTKPSDLSKAIIVVIGGGGEGENSGGSTGAAGGTTSFGAHVSASGGDGGQSGTRTPGSGSSGDKNFTGETGTAHSSGFPYGGAAPSIGFATSMRTTGSSGQAATGYGAGGAPFYSTITSVTGGCGGGAARKEIAEASLGATETITIGAGGSSHNGGDGGDGVCIVYEFK